MALESNRLPLPLLEQPPLERDPRAQLTSDVDALLDVFDRIEHSIAADVAGGHEMPRHAVELRTGANGKKPQGAAG